MKKFKGSGELKMMVRNGKPFSFDKSEINPNRKKASVKSTVMDVVVFLLVSAGYILQVRENIRKYYSNDVK